MQEQNPQITKTLELKVVPAEELLDTTFMPTGTLVDGLLGQGIYILAGAPKVGKSWLVLWLATEALNIGAALWEVKYKDAGSQQRGYLLPPRP